jgi:condensin complex subunit 3
MRPPTHKLIISERDGVTADLGVHLDLGIEILKSVLAESSRESLLLPAAGRRVLMSLGEMRKALVSFLSKLNLPEADEVEGWKVKALALLISSIRRVGVPVELDNAF